MRNGTPALDISLPIACSFAIGGFHMLRMIFTEDGELRYIRAPCTAERDATTAAKRFDEPTCAEIASYVRHAIKTTAPSEMSGMARCIPIPIEQTTLRGVYEDALRVMVSHAIGIRLKRDSSLQPFYLTQQLATLDPDALSDRRNHMLNKSIARVFGSDIAGCIHIMTTSRGTEVSALDAKNGSHWFHFAKLEGKHFELINPSFESSSSLRGKSALVKADGFCIPCNSSQSTVTRHVLSEKHRKNVVNLCKRIVAHLNKRLEVRSV